MEKYDVIVIGGGPGGLAAAYPLAAGGKRVLVVERDLWGGTCPNYGCDPKKMLYSAVQAKKRAALMTRAGLVGIPDMISAFMHAAAPGTGVTLIPASIHCLTSSSPGSDIPGVPASVISATVSPFNIFSTSTRAFSTLLNS